MDLGERLTRLVMNLMLITTFLITVIHKVVLVQQMAFVLIFKLTSDHIMQQHYYIKGSKFYSSDV